MKEKVKNKVKNSRVQLWAVSETGMCVCVFFFFYQQALC